MALGRILIVGILAMAALYLVASAIASLIPYAMGALVIWIAGSGIHGYLTKKDEDSLIK